MLLSKKFEHLQRVLASYPGALTAYSGGADSAFLAEVSHRVHGKKALAVTADSPSIPRRELRDAADLARERGWRHEIVSTNELEDDRYTSNPSDRCYWCKTALFDVVIPMAAGRGVPVLLGTNLDDRSDWRPGLLASEERGALQPLVEAELTKAEVRSLSKQVGLRTYDKPAAACLASRFAYGVRVTEEGLQRVEAAEELLNQMGFRVLRVRDLGDNAARIEVGSDEVARLMEVGESVEDQMRRLGFASVTLDPEGYRSGKLNDAVVLTIGRQP